MNLKAQARKDGIIQASIKTRLSVLDNVSKLSKTDRERVFLGTWSIKDLLAHMTGWDFTNMDAVKSVLSGEVPSFYQYRDRDWQTYNAMLVRKYRMDSFKELLASVKNSHAKLVKLLQSISPEDFNKDFGVRFRGYKVTVQRLLEAETEDERVHAQQIVDFFKVSE